MNLNQDELQKMFSGNFGRKWRNYFSDDITKQFGSTHCDVQDISGGFLNRVYRLCGHGDSSFSVVVKHAPPYVKFRGLEQPLDAQRIYIEYLALMRYNRALPGAVPETYFYDEETKCVVMEDLKTYDVMSIQLSNGHIHMPLVNKLAYVIAKLHRNTHVRTLSGQEFLEMTSLFRNCEMVTLNSKLTFTGMVDPNEPTNHCSPELTDLARSIRDDPVLVNCVKSLHDIFMEQKECLTHGDLHLGSIMVDGCTPKVIDAEFAFVGPAGADIGIILANYLFYYAANLLYPKCENPTFCHRIREAITATVDVYFNEAKEYLSDEALDVLVSQTAGFTGCHIIKWMIGIAQSKDLEGRPQAGMMCLHIGVRLTKEYRTITSPKDLLQHILDSTK